MWNERLGAEMHCRVRWAKLRGRSHIEKDGVNGRRILKHIFTNQGARSGLIRIWTSVGFCEHCNKLRIPLCAGSFWNNCGINNNNNYYLLQLVCYPVAVVILHVNKT